MLLGHTVDVHGKPWDIFDSRETKHGFDLLFGRPESTDGRKIGGLPRLIATSELVDYWRRIRIRHDGSISGLPAGRTTLKRMRRRLGFDYFDDIDAFWKEHATELQQVGPRKFSTKHDITPEVAFEARFRVLGRTARQPSWWRTPENIEILQSHITYREKSEKLGISISHSKRLTDRVRKVA
jgi:hypothetical protein